MISAFGIDHNETVSKIGGWRLTRVPKKKTLASTIRPSGTQKAKDALNRVGEAHLSIKGVGRGTSRAISNTGTFMQNHPGVTGTAVVGGSSAGAATYLKNREPKKKRS